MIRHYAVVTGVLVDGVWQVEFDHHALRGFGVAFDVDANTWLTSNQLSPQAQEDDGKFMSLVRKSLNIGGGFDEAEEEGNGSTS